MKKFEENEIKSLKSVKSSIHLRTHLSLNHEISPQISDQSRQPAAKEILCQPPLQIKTFFQVQAKAQIPTLVSHPPPQFPPPSYSQLVISPLIPIHAALLRRTANCSYNSSLSPMPFPLTLLTLAATHATNMLHDTIIVLPVPRLPRNCASRISSAE